MCLRVNLSFVSACTRVRARGLCLYERARVFGSVYAREEGKNEEINSARIVFPFCWLNILAYSYDNDNLIIFYSDVLARRTCRADGNFRKTLFAYFSLVRLLLEERQQRGSRHYSISLNPPLLSRLSRRTPVLEIGHSPTLPTCLPAMATCIYAQVLPFTHSDEKSLRHSSYMHTGTCL